MKRAGTSQGLPKFGGKNNRMGFHLWRQPEERLREKQFRKKFLRSPKVARKLSKLKKRYASIEAKTAEKALP